MCTGGDKNRKEDLPRAVVKEKMVLLKGRRKQKLEGVILWGGIYDFRR